jgi:hypothetical protein
MGRAAVPSTLRPAYMYVLFNDAVGSPVAVCTASSGPLTTEVIMHLVDAEGFAVLA